MTIVGLKWDHRVVILQRYWDSEKLTSKVKKKIFHCSICIILCNSRISMLCAGYCQVRKTLQLAASILILQPCKYQLPLNHLVAVTKLSAEQCEHHIFFSDEICLSGGGHACMQINNIYIIHVKMYLFICLMWVMRTVKQKTAAACVYYTIWMCSWASNIGSAHVGSSSQVRVLPSATHPEIFFREWSTPKNLG